MKIIDDEVIEEAAKKYSYAFGSGADNAIFFKGWAILDFIAGFKEAEQQLTPLFVEFVEWTSYNYTSSDGVHCKIGGTGIDNWITSQQLFEEFINQNKK